MSAHHGHRRPDPSKIDDHHVDDVLRTMDSGHDVDTRRGPRAAVDLERILATDPSPTASTQLRGGDVARRGGVAAGLVAAATAGVLVVSSTLGGEAAYASWTASPNGLSAQETAVAEQGCRERHRQNDIGVGMFPELDAAQIAVAERRGDWTMVVLTGPGDFFADCITPTLEAGFGQDGDWSAGASTGDRAPGPRELTMKSFGTATLHAGPVSVVAGRAGKDVAGVTYSSRSHGDVAATVSGGAFALWFPGKELNGPQLARIDVHVTYRDGTAEAKALTVRETN